MIRRSVEVHKTNFNSLKSLEKDRHYSLVEVILDTVMNWELLLFRSCHFKDMEKWFLFPWHWSWSWSQHKLPQITHGSRLLQAMSLLCFFYLKVPQAKALYSYRGHNPGELRFNKGDTIILHRQLDENWYLGEINGVSGVFPTNSVQVIKQLPQPLPLCRALYNFDLKSRNRNEKTGCLPFHKVSLVFTRPWQRSHLSIPSSDDDQWFIVPLI